MCPISKKTIFSLLLAIFIFNPSWSAIRNYPEQYPTIQSAIDNAQEWDIISINTIITTGTFTVNTNNLVIQFNNNNLYVTSPVIINATGIQLYDAIIYVERYLNGIQTQPGSALYMDGCTIWGHYLGGSGRGIDDYGAAGFQIIGCDFYQLNTSVDAVNNTQVGIISSSFDTWSDAFYFRNSNYSGALYDFSGVTIINANGNGIDVSKASGNFHVTIEHSLLCDYNNYSGYPVVVSGSQGILSLYSNEFYYCPISPYLTLNGATLDPYSNGNTYPYCPYQ